MTHGAVSMQGNITKSRSQLRLGTGTSWLRLVPRLEHPSKDKRSLEISFYIRPALDAPLACVLASRGLTRPVIEPSVILAIAQSIAIEPTPP
jgi:hypothetical protein